MQPARTLLGLSIACSLDALDFPEEPGRFNPNELVVKSLTTNNWFPQVDPVETPKEVAAIHRDSDSERGAAQSAAIKSTKTPVAVCPQPKKAIPGQQAKFTAANLSALMLNSSAPTLPDEPSKDAMTKPSVVVVSVKDVGPEAVVPAVIMVKDVMSIPIARAQLENRKMLLDGVLKKANKSCKPRLEALAMLWYMEIFSSYCCGTAFAVRILNH
ncbi:hypothetical protein PtA15_4A671 [Puccinia triticina]|uniref:Uncharacterized protein n=1 Tax=Puccinia triticina TaxID=208348 RepID=A0ABY7CHR9_9BASI|nr:uncharacterized protein PtA15_4A671 [Puccinia triticina]WAQ84219.1 hypothetical protein PtA15_4A671 [Puccinia triticina]WAR55046.1 hypothetical protein PtB15_4B665 [Puccinia triticina]